MQEIFREIKSKVVFYYTKQLDYPAHFHEDIELVYVKQGQGVAFCDGKRYELTAGSFFLTFPNQVHHYIESNHGEYILLVLKPHDLLCHHERYLTTHPSSASVSLTPGKEEHVADLLEWALKEYNNNAPDSVVQSYLTTFFEKLLTFYDVQPSTPVSDTVLRILQYCSMHFKEDISVADVAQDLHISKSTVSHIFGARLGVGFCDHINALRLTHALYLLRDKAYSITEISALAGFPTTRTFNRAFQKQYGTSPSLFRKSIEI